MPNAKPREGSSNAEDDSQATFTLRVLELLGDTEVVSKIKRALYPDDLMAEIKELRAEITQLRSVVDEKDRVNGELHNRCFRLMSNTISHHTFICVRRCFRAVWPPCKCAHSGGCGVGRRRRRFRQSAGRHQQHDATAPTAERRRRRGLPSTRARNRSHTSQDNDQVGKTTRLCIQCGGQLKTFNKTKEPAQRVYINEDLTKRRSLMAYETRKLRASKKIADCGTYDGHVVIKDNNNSNKRISSPQ